MPLSEDTLLPQRFFARDVAIVARELLGALLVRDRGTPGEVVLRITETEAYGGQADTASHCRAGRTERNAPMWGPAGHAYVYVIYGLHHLLNLVTGEDGHGQAALVRACEPVSGLELVRLRRGGIEGPALLAGPGKVGAALALDRSFSGRPVFVPGALEVHRGEPVDEILVGPRVGVDYARPRDRDAKLRFAAAGSRWVTARSRLVRARPSGRSSLDRHGRRR